MQIMISLLIAMALKTTLPDPEDPDSKFFGAWKKPPLPTCLRPTAYSAHSSRLLPRTSRGTEL